MSSNLAQSRPATGWVGRTAPRPHEDDRPSHLEVVTTRSQRRARPRPVYALVTVGTLLGIVVAQLLLSIAVSQGAYQIGSLQSTQKALQRSYQAATEDLNRVSSPQHLADAANALGMVSNSNPVYLRLSDGAILGTPTPAAATAGTVTGGQGNLVPNSLLAGVPLPGVPAAGSSAPSAAAPTAAPGATAGNPVATGAPAKPTPQPTVPLTDAIPSPVTH
ncbi:MAG: hypothetical protein JWP70_1599 [Leifsonia sp.]|jgi:hypothetical protein|nr:hypothetical protein [Leifsonia sp.]MDQ1587350.1 hypothetical protein [Microbacteriaceae bacterium]